jgi:adenylosuccinate lyase
LVDLVENLLVYPQNMQKNLDKLNGLVFSQRTLLTLIEEAKISREDAYRIVQSNAMKVWAEGINFLELLKQDKEVTKHLSNEKLEAIFDASFYSKNVDRVFDKVFRN